MIAVGVLIGYVLVGYLVNGPTQRPLVPRVVADTSSAAPSADRVQIGTTAAPTAAASPPAAAAPAAPDPRAAAAQILTAEVREVQGRLRAMGFNPGPVDGSVGPLTENAAKQYQRARGLEVTGAVDRNLLAQVRQETPPRRYASNTVAAHWRPRNDFNDFLGSLDRLFRR